MLPWLSICWHRGLWYTPLWLLLWPRIVNTYKYVTTLFSSYNRLQCVGGPFRAIWKLKVPKTLYFFSLVNYWFPRRRCTVSVYLRLVNNFWLWYSYWVCFKHPLMISVLLKCEGLHFFSTMNESFPLLGCPLERKSFMNFNYLIFFA